MKTTKQSVIKTINSLSACVDNQTLLDNPSKNELKQAIENSALRQLVESVAKEYLDGLDDGSNHDDDLRMLLNNLDLDGKADSDIEVYVDSVLVMVSTYLADQDMFSAYYWMHKYEKASSVADLDEVRTRLIGDYDGQRDFGEFMAKQAFGDMVLKTGYFDLKKYMDNELWIEYEFCPAFMEYGFVFRKTSSDIENSKMSAMGF